jgi:hypothetical protein
MYVPIQGGQRPERLCEQLANRSPLFLLPFSSARTQCIVIVEIKRGGDFCSYSIFCTGGKPKIHTAMLLCYPSLMRMVQK